MSIDFQQIPTRAALALQKQNGKAQSEFKVFVFEEPKLNKASKDEKPKMLRKLGGNQSDNTKDATDKRATENRKNLLRKEDDEGFDVKKARNEVINFAIANQRLPKSKRRMEIFKAIKLGAKPPKKAYKNYKELKDERHRLKQIREERWKYHQLGKNQTGAASVKCRNANKEERRNKKRAPVTNIDKHYGVAKPSFKKKK